jgi:hypothetical protein
MINPITRQPNHLIILFILANKNVIAPLSTLLNFGDAITKIKIINKIVFKFIDCFLDILTASYNSDIQDV